MAGEQVTELARRTASVIPEPPGAHDPFGYLAWEELVLGAAARLGALSPAPAPTDWSQGLLDISPATGRLEAQALTSLAAVLYDGGTAAGAALLHMSVEAWRMRATSVAPALVRPI